MKLSLVPSPVRDPVHEEVIAKLVTHWAEQGQAWGLGRTPAVVHGWLFATGAPACIEEIAAACGLSPSAAGAGCAALRDWGLIRPVRVAGDRRNYYEAELDVETVVKTILRERQRRELAPALILLSDLTARLAAAPPPKLGEVKRADLARRLHDLHRAATLADQFANAMLKEKGLASWIARRFGRLVGRK